MMMNSIKATSHQVCCIVAKFLGYAARPISYIRTLRYKATVDATNTPLPGSFVLETSYKQTTMKYTKWKECFPSVVSTQCPDQLLLPTSSTGRSLCIMFLKCSAGRASSNGIQLASSNGYPFQTTRYSFFFWFPARYHLHRTILSISYCVSSSTSSSGRADDDAVVHSPRRNGFRRCTWKTSWIFRHSSGSCSL